MPFFDSATLQYYDSSFDDEPLLIDAQFESGSNADGYSLTYVKYYQISAADFVTLCLQQPVKGHMFAVDLPGLGRVWYEVNQVRIDREGSQKQLFRPNAPANESPHIQIINVKVSIDLTSVSDPEKSGEYTSPLDLPPYNLKCGSELLEQSVTYFHNTGVNFNDPPYEEFVNTAGVPLQASTTRPLVRITFSFNVAECALADVYQYVGCVNSEPIVICGLDFDRYQVKLESLNLEACKEVHEITLPDGTPGEETTNYIRVDVSLLVDPQTFERQYLNVGTHIVQDGGLHRIWCGTKNWREDNSEVWQSGGNQQGGQSASGGDPGTTIAQGGEEGGTQVAQGGESDPGGEQSGEPSPTADEWEDPGEDPGVDPTVDPGEEPIVDPGDTPGEEPGDDPGEDPTVDPTTDPTVDPGYQEPTYDEDKTFGETYYGSVAQVMKAGLKDPQEVSENMFLNEDGTMIMPFKNGRQVPSFRTGIIEPLVDLKCLNLPTAPPFIWNIEVKPKENDG